MSASASSGKAGGEREPSKRIPKKPIFPGEEDKTVDPKGPDKKKQKVVKPAKVVAAEQQAEEEELRELAQSEVSEAALARAARMEQEVARRMLDNAGDSELFQAEVDAIVMQKKAKAANKRILEAAQATAKEAKLVDKAARVAQAVKEALAREASQLAKEATQQAKLTAKRAKAKTKKAKRKRKAAAASSSDDDDDDSSDDDSSEDSDVLVVTPPKAKRAKTDAGLSPHSKSLFRMEEIINQQGAVLSQLASSQATSKVGGSQSHNWLQTYVALDALQYVIELLSAQMPGERRLYCVCARVFVCVKAALPSARTARCMLLPFHAFLTGNAGRRCGGNV